MFLSFNHTPAPGKLDFDSEEWNLRKCVAALTYCLHVDEAGSLLLMSIGQFWTCHRCTFENPGVRGTCEICGAEGKDGAL